MGKSLIDTTKYSRLLRRTDVLFCVGAIIACNKNTEAQSPQKEKAA